MADFCRQCVKELFDLDGSDLAGLGNGEPLKEGYGWPALCEGCGPILVDDEGNCLGCEKHEKKTAN